VKTSPRLAELTLADASDAVRSMRVSPLDLTRNCLARIERFNGTLNAFITVTSESALAEAGAAEAEIQRGDWKGPLHGIPIALKDLVDTAGVRTTGASNVFRDRIPAEDAEIVRRLKAAGAVLLGKLNLHEFAFGATSVVSCFGAVRNPWNPDYIAGGSSGGAGAAVAAGLCLGAVGTDTGGSIREPASFCGIVGLKPTYGRVSTRGVIPLSPSLDHVGPMTGTAKDAALMLQVLAGYDPEDATSSDAPVADYVATIDQPTSSLRLGIPRALFYDVLHPEIQAAMDAALDVLRTLTASQREVGPLATSDDYASVLDPYRFVISAESHAYHREHVDRTPDLYDANTLRRVRAGAKVDTATYDQARRQLDAIRFDAAGAFVAVDLMVTPTSPVPPLTIRSLQADPRAQAAQEALMLRNTRVFNVLGLPTVSVPCGFTCEGLPIGMQITGPLWSEAAVLRLAHAYEQATTWHTRQPAME
jgi:aspartyl-tRNA(Asn)/glutamyl-tRNA(Gln) amidotransferase subunit A